MADVPMGMARERKAPHDVSCIAAFVAVLVAGCAAWAGAAWVAGSFLPILSALAR